MTQPQETRTPHRFRITSIIIALAIATVFLLSSLAPFLASSNATIGDSQPIKANIQTATGDVYGGSGEWNIDEPTVYDGTDVTVHGNLSIGGETASRS